MLTSRKRDNVIPTNSVNAGSTELDHGKSQAAIAKRREPTEREVIERSRSATRNRLPPKGFGALLNNCPDLKLLKATDSLNHAMELAPEASAGCADSGQGVRDPGDPGLAGAPPAKQSARTAKDDALRIPAIVIWGVSVTEAEALRFLQAGARGDSAQDRGASRDHGVPADGGGGAKLDGGLRVPRFGALGSLSAQRADRARAAGAGTGGAGLQEQGDRAASWAFARAR